MAKLTYQQLKQIINNFTEDELKQHATIHLTGQDEYFTIERATTVKHTDVLDAGHVVLEVRDCE